MWSILTYFKGLRAAAHNSSSAAWQMDPPADLVKKYLPKAVHTLELPPRYCVDGTCPVGTLRKSHVVGTAAISCSDRVVASSLGNTLGRKAQRHPSEEFGETWLLTWSCAALQFAPAF